MSFLERFERLTVPGIGALPVLRLEPVTCPYLPDQVASLQLPLDSDINSAQYQHLMDVRFRRSGEMFYRPDCPSCHACVPIRVSVLGFAPSRSQRRVARRNADVTWTWEAPAADDESYGLYVRYQTAVHGERPPAGREEWERTLLTSPLETFVMSYRVDGRLIGHGIIDVTPLSLSSVYFVYEPGECRRSLGVYSALCEIEACRRLGRPYWYLGLHVFGCAKMEYKTQFRPYELLGEDGAWRAGA